MIPLIMVVPMPPIFILDSFVFPLPFGSIMPNIFSIGDFPLADFPGSRKEEMAQKVLSTDLKAFALEEEELIHLKHEIQKNVKDIIGVNTEVTLVPPSAIQRSEGKAKRVIDKRKL